MRNLPLKSPSQMEHPELTLVNSFLTSAYTNHQLSSMDDGPSLLCLFRHTFCVFLDNRHFYLCVYTLWCGGSGGGGGGVCR